MAYNMKVILSVLGLTMLLLLIIIRQQELVAKTISVEQNTTYIIESTSYIIDTLEQINNKIK